MDNYPKYYQPMSSEERYTRAIDRKREQIECLQKEIKEAQAKLLSIVYIRYGRPIEYPGDK